MHQNATSSFQEERCEASLMVYKLSLEQNRLRKPWDLFLL